MLAQIRRPSPARRLGMRSAPVAALVLAAVLTVGVGSASAATLDVCSSGCPYTTIQAALAEAQSGDAIQIGPGVYSGGFWIDEDVSLVGAGAETTIIDVGTSDPWAVRIAVGASVTIARVSVAHGAGLENAGTLALHEATVSDNTGGSGGGIRNTGTLTAQNSTVSGNSVWGLGAGIANFGVMTLTESTVSGNTGGGGIGIHNGGALTLTDSTVSGNYPGGSAFLGSSGGGASSTIPAGRSRSSGAR